MSGYRIETTVAHDFYTTITATVRRDSIRVSSDAGHVGLDHEYAEKRAKATIAVIRRARAIHRRIFGRSAP